MTETRSSTNLSDLESSTSTLRGRDLGLLVAASFCCAMSLLDTNVMALASPVIADAMGADSAGARWVISAFFLGFASSLLPAGAISDRNGRRRVLLWGLGALALTSLLAGCAFSMALLIWTRAAQGVAMAFVLAPALALIGHRFHEPEARARAWMLWGSIMGLTMVVAPFLGGLIVQWTGWRGAFLLNLPICAGLALAIRDLATESGDRDRDPPDFPAILCFAAMMFCLTWVLITGPLAGWSSAGVLGVGGIGMVALAALVLRTRTSKAADEPPLYRQPRLVGAVLAMFAYAATAQVMASLLPVGFQVLAGSNPAQIGLLVLPFTSAMLIFPQIGAMFSARIGVWRMLLAGLATVAVGAAAAAAFAGEGALFIAALFVIGAGAGIMNGETQKAIMMSMPHGRTGLASGISTTARFSGVLIGFTALSGMIDASAPDLSGIAPAMVGAMVVAIAAAGLIGLLVRERG